MSQKEGWVYCISNENVRSSKVPNNVLLKIGMTERTVKERLAEANKSDTWRPPVNYKIEFAKKVKNPLQKEKTIHKLLEQYNERVNRSREFFDISVKKARLYFDLMDGEYLELQEEPKEDPREELKEKDNLKPKRQTGGRKKKYNNVTTDTNIEENPTNVEINDSMSGKTDNGFKTILHAKIKDLSNQESKKLLSVAFDKDSIDIIVNNTYYSFNNLSNIPYRHMKNKVFTAVINSPTHPIIFITPTNIDSVINTILYKTDSTFILLTEVCKM